MQGVASYYLLSNSQIPMSKVDLRFPSSCPYHEPLGWQTLGFWDRRCAEGSTVDVNVDLIDNWHFNDAVRGDWLLWGVGNARVCGFYLKFLIWWINRRRVIMLNNLTSVHASFLPQWSRFFNQWKVFLHSSDLELHSLTPVQSKIAMDIQPSCYVNELRHDAWPTTTSVCVSLSCFEQLVVIHIHILPNSPRPKKGKKEKPSASSAHSELPRSEHTQSLMTSVLYTSVDIVDQPCTTHTCKGGEKACIMFLSALLADNW